MKAALLQQDLIAALAKRDHELLNDRYKYKKKQDNSPKT